LKLLKIPWIILHNHDYFNTLTQTYRWPLLCFCSFHLWYNNEWDRSTRQ